MPADPNKPVEVPSNEYLTMVAETNFGSVYTNPLLSRVVRYALGLIITFAGTKLFKADANTINVQDYVELAMVVIGSCCIIWYRWKSTHTIMSVTQAADKLMPVLEKAITPSMQASLINTVREKNAKVADLLVGQLEDKADDAEDAEDAKNNS